MYTAAMMDFTATTDHPLASRVQKNEDTGSLEDSEVASKQPC